MSCPHVPTYRTSIAVLRSSARCTPTLTESADGTWMFAANALTELVSDGASGYDGVAVKDGGASEPGSRNRKTVDGVRVSDCVSPVLLLNGLVKSLNPARLEVRPYP